MIAVKVSVAQKGKPFSKVAAAIPMAIARGLNEGGDRVRTQVQRSLWKQTGATKYASITSRVRTVRAYGADGSDIAPGSLGGLNYTIIVAGKPVMKLDEFKWSFNGKVAAPLWTVNHVFPRSFMLNGQFKMRSGSKRLPLHTLLGPNLAKEASRGVTPSVFTFSAREFVVPAILKHLAKATG